MPNLRDFLSKDENHGIEEFDAVDGSFRCQNSECEDVTLEAFFDRAHYSIKWTCVNGHDSSVKI
jgi:hypothetical protein